MNTKEIGETVKNARSLKGWSQEKLAQEAGAIGQSTVDRIEKGDFKRMPSVLPQICGALGIELPAMAGYVIDLTEPIEPGADLPVHCAAEGGLGEIIVDPGPIAYLPRPAPLAYVKNAYGLNITGTSMEPEFRPGETALVNPALPIIGGEVYIFYAEKAGEARAAIKLLRRATAAEWHVSQHNAKPREFTMLRREWQWAHRVIGKYSRQ